MYYKIILLLMRLKLVSNKTECYIETIFYGSTWKETSFLKPKYNFRFKG